MKSLIKKIFLTLLFLSLFALILSRPQVSLLYAATGLKLWFDRMVPTLFPFMILSTLIIRQNLTESFADFLYPIFGKLYRISKNGVYCLMLGFLCGFPMGARTIGEMYGQKKLSRREASFLLAFCNNIGPVYYISFFLPVTGLTKLSDMPFLLFGMYGIPLLYGLFIRYTGLFLPKKGTFADTAPAFPKKASESFQDSLDCAMESAIAGITTLGGYMILCNLLNLYPYTFCKWFSIEKSTFFMAFSNCLFEITGGLSALGQTAPFCSLILLPIGGLSCLAQTKSMIKHTDLSMRTYLLHKGVQTLLTAGYYFLLRFFLL
ncbi:MAG: hypothetical protein IJX66_01630 [Lachnospiraceae bacterium]|nr:hypothetical protein [Lachnospiraceae bacterium]